jgi:hypothetical protein
MGMTVDVRPSERAICLDVLDVVIDIYESRDVDGDDTNSVETIERIQYELDNADDWAIEMPQDWWDTLVTALGEQPLLNRDDVSTTRIGWLQTKLARRTEQDAMTCGYTSMVPVGYMLTGHLPWDEEFESHTD